MKLAKIIETAEWKQDSDTFSSKKTGVNPTTGTVSWDIDYTPLHAVVGDLEDTAEHLKEAIKDHREDQELYELYMEFRTFKRKLKTHINRKYSK